MSHDKFHGQGGTFEVRNGERVRSSEPQKVHKDGDRARDADGKPVDKLLDQVEPALPKPQPAPWAQPAAAAETKTVKKGA
jgi:hypothetical protein